MRSDMGLSELMAKVVVGIAVSPAMLGVAAGAVAVAGAVPAPCGDAALALWCMTARESTMTDTTGKNTMIQRTFMDANLYSCYAMKSYAAQAKAVIPPICVSDAPQRVVRRLAERSSGTGVSLQGFASRSTVFTGKSQWPSRISN